MVKVSISLPNNTQITFESDEAEVLREVVSMALRDLPRDLMQTAADGDQSASSAAEKSTGVAGHAGNLRSKNSLKYPLDNVTGIGPKRKRMLMRRFGTLKGIREAAVDDLASVPGMTRSLAIRLKQTI